MIELRVLLSFEERHRTFMDAVWMSIRQYRPDAEVRYTVPEALEEEIYRFDPHLLVCEPPVPKNTLNPLPAFIELSIDPSQPARFRVGQLRWELLNPGIRELLAVVDETENVISSSSS